MADEDDVDAALALFEEEIKDVPVVLDENLALEKANSSAGADPPKPDVRIAEASPSTLAAPAHKPLVTERPPSTDAAAGHGQRYEFPSVEHASQPEWQRALQERDAMRMRANMDVPLGTATQVSTNPPPHVVSPMLKQSVVTEGSPVARSEETSTQLGAWVWDGWQWIWNPAAPCAGTGSQAGQLAGSRHSRSSEFPLREGTDEKSKGGKTKILRAAAGNVWKDHSLEQWPDSDFRIFVGDLAPDATEDELKDAFSKYKSYNMCRVVVDKRTGEGKGYGFVSFAKGEDMVAALREMNGKYVGTRPVKLKKSDWQRRSLTSDRRKDMKVFKSTGLVAKKRRHK